MKAQFLDKPKDAKNHPLVLKEVAKPHPKQGQILVKVNVCAVCRTDLHVVEGDLKLENLPITPGHQIVGVIEEVGSAVTEFNVGDRVGIAWVQATCGQCEFCLSGRENLCLKATFTGWTAPGGYAEYIVTPTRFVYSLPQNLSDVEVAPLLCAGIIGYRSLKLMDLKDWKGKSIGMYGFGAAAHIAIQLLHAWGAEVYVCTRERNHQELAKDLGAKWVGGATDQPPVLLDGSILYAPAGELVPVMLKALNRDGRLIIAGIHLSPIPSFSYDLLYGEKMIRSVTNNTREDAIEFLKEAARIGIKTYAKTFPLTDANDALCALKYDHIQGAAVLVVG